MSHLTDAFGAFAVLGIFLFLLSAGKTSWAEATTPRRRPMPSSLYASTGGRSEPRRDSTRGGAPPGIRDQYAEHAPLLMRQYVATAINPCDHPFDELALTDLHDHLYKKHWEVWNVLGERNPAPARWRKEHASDHGVVVK